MNCDLIKILSDEIIDNRFDELWKISKYIHSNPEIAFEEEKACTVLSNYLKSNEFIVETGLADLSTSFKAVYKKGNSKIRIAIFAEYDALVNLGHACGHNLIATSALGSAVAVKEALKQSSFEGSIEVYGTPAEEDGGGKIIMLNKGCFDELDAVFLMHPTSSTTRIAGECISFSEYKVSYKGKSAHAESHPENGINALDAATLFYQAIGLMRQQLKDGIRVCCVINKASEDIGQIPAETTINLEISSMNSKDIEDTEIKIKNISKGMALATGCKVKFEKIPGYLGRVPNTVLANVCKKELNTLNEPVMEGIPSDKGGEDLGNVSRIIPICNLYGTILPERKISGHTLEFKKLAISENGKHCLKVTSKAMARSILSLFDNPSLLLQAKEELKERMALLNEQK